MLHMIVNPTSGNGQGAQRAPELLECLKRHGIACTRHDTDGVGHATRIVTRLVEGGARDFLCVGGDGTLSEVAMGLCGHDALLYLAPTGTGNDFARAAGLPIKAVTALETQLAAPETRVDMGRVIGRAFLNVAGAGFDTMVLENTVRFKRFARGQLPFMLGLLCALIRYKPLDLTITVDGRARRVRTLIVAVANGRYYGGGMCVAPHAELGDGLFDVIIVGHRPRWKILTLLPKFVSGKYLTLPDVSCERASRVRVECKDMLLNTDGELARCDGADFEMVPGAIRMRLPART